MSELAGTLRRVARGEVHEGLPLAARTSVRVGGPAQLWVRPRDPEALVAVLGVLCDAGVPWFSLGGGANTIVGDGGIEGCVLQLGRDFVDESVEEGGDHAVLVLGAGAPIARFISLAREQRGVGVAWAAGIPGTIGGMVTMNAGTNTGSAKGHLDAVEVATPDGLRWLPATELKLSYRHCELPRGAVLTRARCRVRRGNEDEQHEDVRAAKADVDRRRASQPLSLPNSGSVFEQAGLKGARRGGAQISEKHANFIVNLGEARASDVVDLIALARRAVLAMSGIELVPEVRLVGTFHPSLPEELSPYHFLPVLLARSA